MLIVAYCCCQECNCDSNCFWTTILTPHWVFVDNYNWISKYACPVRVIMPLLNQLVNIMGLIYQRFACVKTCNFDITCKQMCKLIYCGCTLRIASLNEQDSAHCGFNAFALMNIQHECANYREEKIRVHELSTSNAIYQSWKWLQWLCLCLNLIPLKRRCRSAQCCTQTAAVIGVRKRHRRNERMCRGCL